MKHTHFIKVSSPEGTVLKIPIDEILYNHIKKSGNKMGMKRKIKHLLEYAFSLRISCPICKTKVQIYTKAFYLARCSKCYNRIVVLKDDVVVSKTEDLHIRKVSCFKIACSRNQQGLKKIYAYLRAGG